MREAGSKNRRQGPWLPPGAGELRSVLKKRWAKASPTVAAVCLLNMDAPCPPTQSQSLRLKSMTVRDSNGFAVVYAGKGPAAIGAPGADSGAGGGADRVRNQSPSSSTAFQNEHPQPKPLPHRGRRGTELRSTLAAVSPLLPPLQGLTDHNFHRSWG